MKTAFNLLRSKIFCVLTLFVPLVSLQAQKSTQSAASTLRIVTENLQRVDSDHCSKCSYVVIGSIYNPADVGIANVTIRYHIWKKFLGDNDRGILKTTGGLVTAIIRYVPPKQTISFSAFGGYVPTQVDTTPDPLQAEVTADWDH